MPGGEGTEPASGSLVDARAYPGDLWVVIPSNMLRSFRRFKGDSCIQENPALRSVAILAVPVNPLGLMFILQVGADATDETIRVVARPGIPKKR